MEDNNLKECWKEIHTGTEIKPMNIKEVIRKKHCRTISQTLRRQKTLISLFAILLAFSVAASIWDTIIMGSASISLWAGSAFCCFCWFRPLDIISSSQGQQTHIHWKNPEQCSKTAGTKNQYWFHHISDILLRNSRQVRDSIFQWLRRIKRAYIHSDALYGHPSCHSMAHEVSAETSVQILFQLSR